MEKTIWGFGQVVNEFPKKQSWFILELYTPQDDEPTPPEYTTYIDAIYRKYTRVVATIDGDRVELALATSTKRRNRKRGERMYAYVNERLTAPVTTEMVEGTTRHFEIDVYEDDHKKKDLTGYTAVTKLTFGQNHVEDIETTVEGNVIKFKVSPTLTIGQRDAFWETRIIEGEDEVTSIALGYLKIFKSPDPVVEL